LAQMAGIVDLDPTRVRTNFVLFRLARPQSGARFLDALRQHGVLMVSYPQQRIRAVTHYGIEARDIDRTLDVVRAVLADLGLAPSVAAATA
ncbi:MAG: hypothetical protein M3253_00175, partial [Chloroflexota bacterium]|nr:hypothetical protein [Chloroflexota bacterium]